MAIPNPLVEVIRTGGSLPPEEVDAEIAGVRERLLEIDAQLGDRSARPEDARSSEGQAYWGWRRRALHARGKLLLEYERLKEYRKQCRVERQYDGLLPILDLTPTQMADPVILLRLCRTVMCRWISEEDLEPLEDEQALLQAISVYFNGRSARQKAEGEG